MPWIKVDDHYDEHQKLADVGPLGQALWLAGLAYCNRNLTDGFIPWSVARNLLSWEFLGKPDEDGASLIYRLGAVYVDDDGDDAFEVVSSSFVVDLLVRAGLWEESGSGYRVHDYADFQPTKAQVLAERAAKQAAGRAGGQASAKARAKAGAKAPPQAESKPVPVPVPVPSDSEESLPSDGPDAFETYQRLTMRIAKGGAAQWIGRLIDKYDEALVERAIVHAHRQDADPSTLLGRVEGLLDQRAFREEKQAEQARKDRAFREMEEQRQKAMSLTPEQEARVEENKRRVAEMLAAAGKEMA